jgi:DNA-binding NarL/FixJ family response regulator
MIQIAIADDHAMFSDGLESLLTQNQNFEIVGKAQNAEEFHFLLKTRIIDIALVDINMPGKSGIELTQEIKKSYTDTKVIILSMHNSNKFIQEALAAGANGYILKNSGPQELVKAIDQVHQGANYFSEEVSQIVLNEMRNPKSETIELSSRELEVLQGICEELTNDEIGEKLFISKNTVKTHRKNLLEKANVKNTAGLVKFAIENDLL